MIKAMIPNICTAANLVFGMCSLLMTFNGDLFFGSAFILLALIADGLDGRVARALGVTSEMGKEMDSLCDLVSFGVAPAILAYRFALSGFAGLGAAAAIVFAVCGMWRLARFNVNTGVVHGYFMGLAIPAGGCLVAATTLLFSALGVIPHHYGLVYPIAIMVTGYLMVSHIHYPDFKGGGEKICKVAVAIAALVFGTIIFFGQGAIVPALLTAVFGTYALFGIINSLFAAFAREN